MGSTTISFVENFKGGKLAVVNEHTFYRNSTVGKSAYFYCSKRKCGCLARVTVYDYDDANGTCTSFKTNGKHNHFLESQNVQKLRAVSKAKELVNTNVNMSASEVLEAVAQECDTATVIGRPIHFRRVILREKRKCWGEKETCPGDLVLTTELRRTRDAAIERLRELTHSVEGSVKAIDLVRKVLKEVPAEARTLMPSEDALIHRVKRWARASNIELVKANPGDYLAPEDNELCPVSRGEAEGVLSNPAPSTSTAAKLEEGAPDDSSCEKVVKTGIVYTKPVSGLPDCTPDRDPSGLIFLRGMVNGHYRAMMDGQSFSWKKSFTGAKFLYACHFSAEGCPVTVTIDTHKKKYELRGSHIHKSKTEKRKKHGAWQQLTRVDEQGNEIGTASLDDFITGTTEWQDDNSSSRPDQGFSQANVSTEFPIASSFLNQEDSNLNGEGDDDFMDHGADDFQTDDLPEEEAEPLQIRKPCSSRLKINTSHIIATSSNPPKKMGTAKPLTKDAVKSGERCFVCGDELIVSETLSSSSLETFRKACCYLNVKSKTEWFPRSTNFYSFCESCTEEITRIHSLYRKVEEIQSLIFRKVESVEKRIVDAEVVDNWMAEAPQTTAVRFEGFRKQVTINYRNKLKLRREIRFGNKSGQPLVEIKPGFSAHMFASDPAETDAFKVPGNKEDETINKNVTGTPIPTKTAPPRRTRGRPKSKKPPEEREDEPTEPVPVPDVEPPLFFDSPDHNDEDGFHTDFDDSQDAMSVTSEKEVKFWENDPSKLNVAREKRNRKSKKSDNDDDYDMGGDIDNESDLDYNDDDDDDDDEDWGNKNRPKSRKRGRNTITDPATLKGRVVRPLIDPKTPKRRGQIVLEKRVSRKKPVESQESSVRRSQYGGVVFPDAVLTKDGRVFMKEVEIIKNPPGAYKLRPYSVSFSCGACGKICPGFWKLRQHICGHHLGMYNCQICHKEFANPKAIGRHVAAQHTAPEYENCEICLKPVRVYKGSRTMQYHRWTHLGQEEKKDSQFQCWEKQKDVSQKPVSETAQSFMCGQCGKTFLKPLALRKHEATHIEGAEVALMCQYCGKTYNKRKSLSQHVSLCAKKAQGYVNLQTYSCPKCPTRFSTRSTRSRHMKRFHSKDSNVELPFTCPKCPRSFATRSGFRAHKRVCIDGGKGYNSKNDPKSSTSSGSFHDTKHDPTSAENISSMGSDNQQGHFSGTTGISQHDTSRAAAALGFNYSFLGGYGYTGDGDQPHNNQ